MSSDLAGPAGPAAGPAGPEAPGQQGMSCHEFWALADERRTFSDITHQRSAPSGPCAPLVEPIGALCAIGLRHRGPVRQRSLLRAISLEPCTVCPMAEPWDNLSDVDTARMCGSLLSDLDARIRIVAHARCAAVHELRAGGMSIRRICDELSLSRWTVCHILKTDPQRSMAATPPNTP